MFKIKRFVSIAGMIVLFVTHAAYAKDTKDECVNNVAGVSFDEEFGAGAGELTTCIKKRTKVKVVYQINKFCRDNVSNSDCALNRPYALKNINNAIKDYEINYGMEQGNDYEIIAVVTGGGGHQMIQQSVNGNQFEGQVKALMDKGVKFYFCQNTVRGLIKKGFLTSGNVTSQLIPGIEFVTSGVAAIPDFVSQDYIMLQP